MILNKIGTRNGELNWMSIMLNLYFVIISYGDLSSKKAGGCIQLFLWEVINMLYLEVLKNRNFTYLLIGNFLRRSCFVLFSLQIIWFTVELTNQSSLKLSMMVMSQTLPFIIFGIFGGAYSDKHNKKKILYLSDLILSLIIIIIPLLAITSNLNYLTLLTISTAITIINCYTDPAFRQFFLKLLMRSI